MGTSGWFTSGTGVSAMTGVVTAAVVVSAVDPTPAPPPPPPVEVPPPVVLTYPPENVPRNFGGIFFVAVL